MKGLLRIRRNHPSKKLRPHSRRQNYASGFDSERLTRLCGAGAPFRPLFRPIPSFLFWDRRYSFQLQLQGKISPDKHASIRKTWYSVKSFSTFAPNFLWKTLRWHRPCSDHTQSTDNTKLKESPVELSNQPVPGTNSSLLRMKVPKTWRNFLAYYRIFGTFLRIAVQVCSHRAVKLGEERITRSDWA